MTDSSDPIDPVDRSDRVDPKALSRFPSLNAAGHQRLQRLTEHPRAPRFNRQGVDRLSPAGRRALAEFESGLDDARLGWKPGGVPPWLEAHTRRCFQDVPFYRGYGPRPPSFFDIPTCGRADLSRAPWDFVPDSQPLDGLLVYQTSGSTGHPLDILSHPDTVAHYLPLLRRALALHGVALEDCRPDTPEQPHISLAVICSQAFTFTYAAVLAYLNQAGFVKINLNPADWTDPADRAAFLDACNADIYSGDPLSLADLAALSLATRPRGIVSTALSLLPGLRQQLEVRFGCPVVDIYSMNECGPVAAAAPGAGDPARHVLLSHRLYLEILDPDGAPCPPGARGEIVISGGFNPFLPLLRYRTGDWASLDLDDPLGPCLVGLEGRPPVTFRAGDGRRVNSIDVSLALKHLALPQFSLHQAADGALELQVIGAAVAPVEPALRAALAGIFGPEQPVDIGAGEPDSQGKRLQYTSDLPGEQA